jgi:hypothetical protein
MPIMIGDVDLWMPARLRTFFARLRQKLRGVFGQEVKCRAFLK